MILNQIKNKKKKIVRGHMFIEMLIRFGRNIMRLKINLSAIHWETVIKRKV